MLLAEAQSAIPVLARSLEIAALQLDTAEVLQTIVLLGVNRHLDLATSLDSYLHIQFRLMPFVVERRMLLVLDQLLAIAVLMQGIAGQLTLTA